MPTAPTLDLERLRKRIGLNQAEMAKRMGMGARAYFTLEQNPKSINERHVMLAQMVSLQEAVSKCTKSLALDEIADLAEKFAAIPEIVWTIYTGPLVVKRTNIRYRGDENGAKRTVRSLLDGGEQPKAVLSYFYGDGGPDREISTAELKAWLEGKHNPMK